jgi:hypothetical protein
MWIVGVGVPVRGEEDVLGFEIAVDDAFLVEEAKGGLRGCLSFGDADSARGARG